MAQLRLLRPVPRLHKAIARSRSLGLRLARHHQPGGGQIVLLRAPRHPRRLGRLGRIREPRIQRRGEKGLWREQEKGSTTPKTESKTRVSRERRRGAMAPEEMQATKRLLAQHIHTTKRLLFASFAHQCPTGVVRQRQTGGRRCGQMLRVKLAISSSNWLKKRIRNMAPGFPL